MSRTKLAVFYKHLEDRLFPISARDDGAVIAMLWKFLLIGLLIRFIFMPFACHMDLLSEYYRAHMLAYHFDLTHSYSINSVLHGISLFLLKPLMPGNLDLFFHPWGSSASGFGTSTVGDWVRFVSQESIFRVLFLFKVPYLIFDIASAFLCLHIFSDNKRGIKIFIFWMLNPVIIYSAYVFGRYDVFVIFLLLMLFYSIKRWNIEVGSLFLGLAILSRGFALLFLPFLLTVKKDLYGKLQILILAFIPIIGYKVLSGIIFSKSGGSEAVLSSVVPSITALSSSPIGNLPFVSTRFVDTVLAVKIDMLSLFVVGYILLLLCVMPMMTDVEKNWMKTITNLNDIFLIVVCLLFAFGGLSMHWFAWIVPFLVIKASESVEFFYAHIYVILGWFVFWATYLTGIVGSSFMGFGLFASINTALIDYPTIGMLMVEITGLPHTSLVVIARSIWVATLLYLVFLTIHRGYTEWKGVDN